MPLNLKHPAFPQPVDNSELVWRYLDLAKYISLLTRRALYFPAANKLGDPFEGSLPKRCRQAWYDKFARQNDSRELNLNTEDTYRQYGAWIKRISRVIYISCWRMDKHESEAMWKLYCGSHQGVAICLPYQNLANSFANEQLNLGCVTYLDYKDDIIEFGQMLSPFVHKRIAFRHENEVRIVKSDRWGEVLSGHRPAEIPDGIEVPWDAEGHVTSVVVSPYAPLWFHEAVRNVTYAFAPALASKVCESAMGGEPSY